MPFDEQQIWKTGRFFHSDKILAIIKDSYSELEPLLGTATESIPVKYNGKDISIAFNPSYLIAPLKHLESDEIFIELSDETSPGVVKSNIPFLYVIMPIRVN